VVRAFLLALGAPRSIGSTYIISQARPYTYEEVYRVLAGILGRSEPRFRLNKRLAKVLMAPIEAINVLLGRDNFLWRRGTVESVTSDRGFSIERAGQELGYEPLYDLPEGIEETAAWYRESGYL
jgi:nucleoside-diphosphate-sugar epimerase